MINMNRILILSAHPDDDILGCGGILSKLVEEGKAIKVIFLAEGTSCRYNYDDIKKKIVIQEIEKRNNMGIAALEYLGVREHSFYNIPCGRLDAIPIIEINKIIEKEINIFKPDTIFTHSEDDANNDHKIVLKSTIMATRPIPKQYVKNILSYEVLSSSEWHFTSLFQPNYFVKLEEEHIKKKITALEYYETEIKMFPFPRSSKGIKTLAHYRGLQIGVEYSEAFKLIRGCV